MNVLITKMMAARFMSVSEREKMCGGFDCISVLFKHIAESYPEHQFYYIGTSDLHGNRIANAPNLIDIYTPIKAYAKANGYDSIMQDPANTSKPFYQAAVDYCKENGLKFDLALFQYEQTLPVAHYADGYISERTGKKLGTLLSQRYPASAFVIASDFNVPLYLMIDDPRQINHIPPDIKPPVKIFAQCKGTDRTRYYIDKKEKKEVATEIEYAEIEKFYLLKKERVDFTDPKNIRPTMFEHYEKDIEFTMTLNGNNIDRYNFVKQWILPYRPDQVIYGRWTDWPVGDVVKNDGLEKNFVRRGMCEMEDVMWRSKYTLVAPPSAKTANFVTQKVYSMLYYGILPFWVKGTYDVDNFYTDISDFLKVDDPEQLWKRIDFLEKNPDEYRKQLRLAYDALKPEYFENAFVHRIFDCILKTE